MNDNPDNNLLIEEKESWYQAKMEPFQIIVVRGELFGGSGLDYADEEKG